MTHDLDLALLAVALVATVGIASMMTFPFEGKVGFFYRVVGHIANMGLIYPAIVVWLYAAMSFFGGYVSD